MGKTYGLAWGLGSGVQRGLADPLPRKEFVVGAGKETHAPLSPGEVIDREFPGPGWRGTHQAPE